MANGPNIFQMLLVFLNNYFKYLSIKFSTSYNRYSVTSDVVQKNAADCSPNPPMIDAPGFLIKDSVFPLSLFWQFYVQVILSEINLIGGGEVIKVM